MIFQITDDTFMRIHSALLLLALSVVPALAGDDFDGQQFVMPSKNINCIIQAERVEGPSDGWRLYCVRNLPKTIAVILNKQGAEGYPTEGDQPFNEDAWVFPYGNVWHEGPFRCTSASEGLTCTHTDGHGFKLSRKGFVRIEDEM